MFLLLYFINWQNFIVWCHLLLKMLGNMYISIICFPGCDVLIKPFSYMAKKLRKKFKYLENEKNF